MDNVPKLTKKRKKSLAFRERKKGKPSSSSKSRHELEMEDTSLPVMEIQDLADLPSSAVEAQRLAGEAVKSGKQSRKAEEREGRRKVDISSHHQQSEESLGVVAARNDKKRKWEGGKESSADSEGQTPKRKKTEEVHGVHGEETTDDKVATMKTQTKQRFILFLGNLKYTTSREAILQHFSACDPPPIVRLLTPKSQKTVNKSKGCAFLEFTHRNALQQALKLHHSELENRRINVELTAGGGGKSVTRLDKVQKRNKALHDQRRKQQLKTKSGKTSDQTQEGDQDRQQRYSSTAGIEQPPPPQKRTWTVQDADNGAVHRGGQKHVKSQGKKRVKTSRNWGTGVNAIPVG